MLDHHAPCGASPAAASRRFHFLGKAALANDGTAAIEFAVIGTVIAALLVGTIDLGLAFYTSMRVENAAQAGAQYAALHGWDSGAITSAATNATSASELAVTAKNFCGCPSGAGIAATACGTACANGLPAGTYVSVAAAKSYSPLVDYPGLPERFTFTSTSIVRIK